MAVTVPQSDTKNTAKAAAVTAIAATIAAQAASGPSADALKQQQLLINRELVVDLMTSGKLNPLTILSTCTYGT